MAAPLQPDHIQADQLSGETECEAERNDVARNAADTADHRAFADAHELVHGHLTAEEDVVADRHMAAEHRIVGKGHAVADMAIVRRHASRP